MPGHCLAVGIAAVPDAGLLDHELPVAGKCTPRLENAVVFIADDMGAWLVGLLADAGRKRLASSG